MLNPVFYNPTQTNFKANLNSPRLRYSQNDFFIKIKGYGQDKNWAKEVIELADSATRMIRKERNIETILQMISLGIFEANRNSIDPAKRIKSGTLRTTRIGWQGGLSKDVFTPYETGRYSIYKDRFIKTYSNPLTRPNNNIGMSRPNGVGDIKHGEPSKINSSLNYVFDLFNKNIKPFTNGSATSKDLKIINDAIAEIRWVLAHSTPWLRGSDAISNVLMRAMYKSVGIKTYPPQKNISFDLQAYCTDLDEYKKNFTSYFIKEPVVIE